MYVVSTTSHKLTLFGDNTAVFYATLEVNVANGKGGYR